MQTCNQITPQVGSPRPRPQRTITVDGQEITASYLGKGLFCKAYRAENTVYILNDGDLSKEAIALFADQTLKHIPTVTRHENHKGYQLFSMPYYRKLTQREFPKAYGQWRKLIKPLLWKVARGPHEIADLIDTLRHEGEHSLADAVSNLYEAFLNYGDDWGMIMEFQKCNVGVDSNGELILRDCLASRDSIKKKREERHSKGGRL